MTHSFNYNYKEWTSFSARKLFYKRIIRTTKHLLIIHTRTTTLQHVVLPRHWWPWQPSPSIRFTLLWLLSLLCCWSISIFLSLVSSDLLSTLALISLSRLFDLRLRFGFAHLPLHFINAVFAEHQFTSSSKNHGINQWFFIHQEMGFGQMGYDVFMTI